MNQTVKKPAVCAPSEAPVRKNPAPVSSARFKRWFGAPTFGRAVAFSLEGDFFDEWPDDRVDRIWKQTDEKMKIDRLFQRKAILVGFDFDDVAVLRQNLRNFGISPVVNCASANHFCDIAKLRVFFDFLFVNLDGFIDVSDGVDALLDYRMKCPGVAIVLVSRAVSGDDLSSERRAICDVTLRAPISSDRLRNGVIEALDNIEDRQAD